MASVTSRDLPMPRPPTISARLPTPFEDAAARARISSISASRPTKGSPSLVFSATRAPEPSHGGRRHGLGLALDLERRHGLGLEGIAGPAERLFCGEHLARAGLAHHAGGQVHGVAGDGEDAAVAQTDGVREDEDPAGVHAYAQPYGRVGRVEGDDVVGGAQHPLGVVAPQDGNAPEEDDLAPVRGRCRCRGSSPRSARPPAGPTGRGDRAPRRRRLGLPRARGRRRRRTRRRRPWPAGARPARRPRADGRGSRSARAWRRRDLPARARTALAPPGPRERPSSSTPSDLGSPTTPASRRAAVSGLTSTSPASAIASMRAVAVAAGPVTTSSRWRSPSR